MSILTRVMMVTTIILIVAFQVYWVKKLYNDEMDSLKRNTDVIFRETVYKLQVARFKKDTVMFRHFPDDNLFNIEAINIIRKRNSDTNAVGQKRPKIIIAMSGEDSQGSRVRMKTFMRTIDTSLDMNEPTGRVQDPGDLPLRVLRRRSLNDSLSLLQLDSAYKKELYKAGIYVPFIIVKNSGTAPALTNVGAELKTNPASVGMMSTYQYQALFYNPYTFLLNQIIPQLIFSFVLVALTIGTFIILYRNLVAQKRLTAIKNSFISNITHELKTPIATVNVAIEALQKFGGLQNPERTKEYLDISALELQRLSLLVDKVLRLSMFESKDITLQKESFNLLDLAQEVIASMRLQFVNGKALVTLNGEGENFIIEADKLHIASVIYNLLDNALKYSKENPEIHVLIVDHKDFIELRVSDNGIGISTEYCAKIFEQFFRVPHGNTHNIKGYGLGLSYVNHIIQRHMGFIEVKSEVEKGSTFVVKLPFKEAPVIYYDDKQRVIRKELLSAVLRKKASEV